MADVSDDIAAAWHLLEITGIIQSVLCALFGTSFSRCHDMNRPRVAVDAHLKPRRRRSVHLAVRSSAVGKPWETERLFAEVADCNDRLVSGQLFFVGRVLTVEVSAGTDSSTSVHILSRALCSLRERAS